jgi:UDPglucose 6-dehydrogenase
MKVAVLGLWYLGPVTAACAAAAGHEVRAWDPDRDLLKRLASAEPPVKEPGLADLIRFEQKSGRLTITTDLVEAVGTAEVVWITFDTPVDDQDHADVEFVVRHVADAFPHLRDDAIVLVSSQLPVGTIRLFEERLSMIRPGHHISVACSPENLHLGRAIEAFTQPDRVVIGVRSPADRERLTELFRQITDRIEWMSVESAEMTKHAVNAFLATSVAFINEIAAICERTGADAREVERGLKTERRIGPLAYLKPGAAFAGGTLARDLTFLRALGKKLHVGTAVMNGVYTSNTEHRRWARQRLTRELAGVAGRRVAVWGLTYKPGTDTLRRSDPIELCRWLLAEHASVAVHDPAVPALPKDLAHTVTRSDDVIRVAETADALVIGTEWPMYRDVDVDQLSASMRGRVVIDANRFLASTVGRDERFALVSVGQPHRE